VKASSRAAAKRLTFKDRHALETLPVQIATLQAEVTKLTTALGDRDMYVRNPSRFAETTAALDAARRQVEAAEERWLELEMLRETLEG
jgi:ATP-binding cassette subfamily F protein uup